MSALNISAVNEALRTAMTGGLVFMTAGVDALFSDEKANTSREQDFGNFGFRVLIQR